MPRLIGRGLVTAAGTLALVASVTGCGSGNAQTATGSSALAGSVTIDIRNFAFAPTPVTVRTGATVTWRNDDPSMHTATSDGKTFDTHNIDPGREVTVTLTAPGTYAYHCAIHQYMTATIVVVG